MNRNPLKPAGGGYVAKSRGPISDAVRTGNMGNIQGAIGAYKQANMSHDNPDKLNGSPGVNKGTLPNSSMAVDNLSSSRQGVRGSLSMLSN